MGAGISKVTGAGARTEELAQVPQQVAERTGKIFGDYAQREMSEGATAPADELGRNVATTPGKVVYQNDLMQLIQYEPTTKDVYKRPLVVMPPWINKYRILDLRGGNSFIRWAVSLGRTVFVISWVNPDARLAAKTFDDYMPEGPKAALEAAEKATGENKIDFIGYCLGGTLLGAFLGWLAAQDAESGKGGGTSRVGTVTFFVALLDFSGPGELGVFIEKSGWRTSRGHRERPRFLCQPAPGQRRYLYALRRRARRIR